MRAIQSAALVGILLAWGVPFEAISQTVERVEVYRNAAVVTWKSELKAGESAVVARSFSPQSEVGLLMAGPESPDWTHQTASHGVWHPESDVEDLKSLGEEHAELMLERALKQAQLDLVEEDLALLRANRNIGGTSEPVLVEDIQDVADWMHEEFRDALYRRVELNGELSSLDGRLAALMESMEAEAPRSVTEHRITVSAEQGGDVWCRTVERNAGWWASDAVLVKQGLATWSQRMAYRVDVPWRGRTQWVFVDADWREGGDSELERQGMTYGRKSKTDVETRVFTSPSFRVSLSEPRMLSGHTRGEVEIGSFNREVAAMHQSRPQEVEAVHTSWVMAKGDAHILPGAVVSLIGEGALPRPAGWRAASDSVYLDAGISETWSIRRETERGLCKRSALGNRIRHHRSYILEVTNASENPGDILIIEPLPRDPSLEVEWEKEALGGGELDDAGHNIIWNLQLQAGESRTIRFSFDVNHDRDVPSPTWE